MESYKKNLVELVSNIAFEYKPFPSPMPPYPQKNVLLNKITSHTPRKSPEDVGISSECIISILRALEENEDINLHSIVIIKDGKIITEAAQPGYDTKMPHLSHSMSKSIIGIAIMMLIEEEKLDTDALVLDFFKKIRTNDKRMQRLTVKHLLCMTSGVGFGEAGVVSESEWLSAFFASDMGFSPGERFAYNSMNSYVLASIGDVICKREFGFGIEDYINTRLFSPLGIEKPHWEKSPEGIIKGGFGLYLCAEDWALVGYAVLRAMSGDKSSPIPEKTLKKGISERVKTDDAVGDFDYGYHLWVEKNGDALLFNGMFGQNVLIDLKNELVIAMNSGNNELFSKSTTLITIRSILEENFTRGGLFSKKRALKRAVSNFYVSRRWIKPTQYDKGVLSLLRKLYSENFLPFYRIVGEYTFPNNNHGILPSFVRIMQNNYTGGIRSFIISVKRGAVHLRSEEVAGSFDIAFGLRSHVKNEIDVLGEKYTVMALAGVELTPAGDAVYKFELLFPELPNSRRITLELTELKRLAVKMTETPDERITNTFIDAIPTLSGRVGMLYRVLEQKFGKSFVEGKLKELFSPEFRAISKNAPDYDAALEEENEKVNKKIESSRLIRSLIFNFLGNEAKMKEIGGGALGKLAGLIGKFF